MVADGQKKGGTGQAGTANSTWDNKKAASLFLGKACPPGLKPGRRIITLFEGCLETVEKVLPLIYFFKAKLL